MKVILAVDSNYIGMIGDYTSREHNMKEPLPSIVEKVISLRGGSGIMSVDAGVVNLINMESSNILLDRVCKMSAGDIFRFFKEKLKEE